MKLYNFAIKGKKTEGSSKDICKLGGKGANLAEMANLGLPIPPGFTVPTDCCKAYHEQGVLILEEVVESVMTHLKYLEQHFGYMPLLSVRSGAAISMPGMMDTVLNVGITDENLEEWKDRLGARTALDCRRRFIEMYADVVLGQDPTQYKEVLATWKKTEGVEVDSELSLDGIQNVVTDYEAIIGPLIPDTVEKQLRYCIEAVFHSWYSPKAVTYRELNGIPDDLFTAVNIQSMVFGNMNDNSGSGVLFTRDPNTGKPEILGEYLPNAQGEDVVAGIRTPIPIKDMWPEMKDVLFDMAVSLEKNYKDMQDIEFTVQDGSLYLLQTRSGKRSAVATIQIAQDMLDEGLIDKELLISRISAKDIIKASMPVIDPAYKKKPVLKGLPASGGMAVGTPVFSSEEAVQKSKEGPVVLCVEETTPDDIAGMAASVGVLTKTGGVTSHAAVVARGMNLPCVVGCLELDIEEWWAKEKVSLNGFTGDIYDHEVPVIDGEGIPLLKTLINSAVGASTVQTKYVTEEDFTNPSVFRVINIKAWSEDLKITENECDKLTNEDISEEWLTTLGVISDPEIQKQVIVDFRSGDSDTIENTKSLNFLVGDCVPAKERATKSWVSKRLFAGSTKGKYYSNIKILEDENANTAPKGSIGFTVVKPANTMADLLEIDKPVYITEIFIREILGGEEALNTIKGLLSSTNIVDLGTTKAELLFKHYG